MTKSKKLILIIIPLIPILFLYYGNIFKSNNNKPNENDYYKIYADNKHDYYCIYNKNHEIVREKIIEGNTLNIKKITNNILEIKEGYGTGIVEKTYYDIENNKFSEAFTYSIANTDTLIAYFKEDNLIIQNIFNKNIYYKKYKIDSINATYIIEGKILDSYFTNNKTLIIKYYNNDEENIKEIDL